MVSGNTTPWNEFVLICAMLFGGSPLLLFVKMLKGGATVLREDEQFVGYLKVCFCCSILTIFSLLFSGRYTITESIRKGALNTISVITTTGLCNDISFEHFGAALFFFFSFIGGCTGSTSGGIKILRLQIIFELLKVHIMQSWRPHNLFTPMYRDQKITEHIALSVYAFFVLYFITIIAATCALTLFDFDVWSSFSAAVAAIGNVGLGFGKIVGADAAIADIPYKAKLVLMGSMILGRLELLTVLMLFFPAFWRK
jgi:trk system potassium uptake protein TrkH